MNKSKSDNVLILTDEEGLGQSLSRYIRDQLFAAGYKTIDRFCSIFDLQTSKPDIIQKKYQLVIAVSCEYHDVTQRPGEPEPKKPSSIKINNQEYELMTGITESFPVWDAFQIFSGPTLVDILKKNGQEPKVIACGSDNQEQIWISNNVHYDAFIHTAYLKTSNVPSPLTEILENMYRKNI